jgi:hypothetical protein
MPTTRVSFDGPERLKEILDTVIAEYASRVVSIRITKGVVAVEFDKEIELPGFGSEELWEQIRNTHILTYNYVGPYSMAVMKDIFNRIKGQGLVPTHLLIHPSAILKQTSEWRDLSVASVAETTYFGLRVVESEAIDDDAFVVAAGHSPDTHVHNVMLGVKGQINAFI